MLGESYVKEHQKIPHAENNVGRRTPHILKDLCDHLIDRLITSHFALQVGEATNAIKDAHLITHAQYVLENDVKDFLCADLLMVELHHWKYSI
jgi:hypothetical protein